MCQPTVVTSRGSGAPGVSSQGHPGPTQQQWSRGSAAPKGEACLEVCSYCALLFRTGGRWRGCQSHADVPGPCFSSSVNRGTVMAGFVLLSCSPHYGPQTAVTGFEEASTGTLLRDPLSRGGSATRLGRGSEQLRNPQSLGIKKPRRGAEHTIPAQPGPGDLAH